MILKSLQLQGFKSFPDKTTLQFDRGVTAVIGPNGSGKSNIADAMKWVLGELSSKNLRGSKMEDVIFGGTDDRGPMSYAEVSVTFDNREQFGPRLSSDYDEVTVTRRYYRAGESEYLMNKAPCRLRDIVELFMNTGIGKEGYSIIGQGKIAEVISQKGEDRRHLFEEAAGISKYKYKKAEAEKKLLGVTENLDRVSDILSELAARVGPLEKDAEKARKYLELYEQKKQTDVSLWLYDMAQLVEEIQTLSDACTLSQKEYDRHEQTLEDLEQQSDRLYAALGAQKEEIDRCSERIVALTEQKMRLQSECDVLQNELSHIEEKRQTNDRDQTTQNTFLQDEQVQLDHAREMLVQMQTDCDTAQAACEADRAEMTRCDAQIDAVYEQIKQSEQARETLRTRRTDLQVELSVLENNRGSETQRRETLQEARQQQQAEMKELQERANRAAQSVQTYEARIAALKETQQKQDAQITQLTEQDEGLQERRRAFFVDFTSKKERMEALRRMEDLLEGYSRSVRTVMQAYKKGEIAGAVIFGPLSKLITVPSKYAIAVETALGAGIQNIVVQNDSSAKAAIRYLKEHGGGRATFYPLNTMQKSELHINLSQAERMDGYVGVASSLLEYDAKYDAVVQNLLGRTLVCDTLDHATALARQFSFRVRVVTLDGQIINAGGSFTGGSLKHENGMLSRNAQMEQLRVQCADIQKQMDQIDARRASLAAQQQACREAISAAGADLEMITALCQAEHTQKEVLQNRLQSAQEAIDRLQLELDQLVRDSENYEQRAAALSSSMQQTQDEEAAEQTRQQQLLQHRDTLQKQMADLQKRLAAHQVALAEANKDADVYRRQIALHEENITRARERFAAIDEENDQLSQTREQCLQQMEEKATLAQKAEEETAACEQKRTKLIAQNGEREQQHAALRTQIRDGNHQKELLFRQLTLANSKRDAALERQDKMTGTLWDDYELTFGTAQALNYPAVDASNRNDAARRQTELRRQLKELGHVNVGAIDEYTEVKQRHDFLLAQVEDLKESKEDLVQIIYQLEEQMRRRFTQAMQDINQAFGEVFSELFGGGHAALTLSDPDDILNSGVEIVAAPPGKIIKNLMLLSGGEQAFVAIALYFALLRVNPAPFCILDEIEAALDEVNVDKFADYLKRHSSQTQFIVITHRRGTMEGADRLYGVTMQEKGVSVVLSIGADQIEHFTDGAHASQLLAR